MEGWEYKIVTLGRPPEEERLNDEGKLGWELVSVVLSGYGDVYYAFFKKHTE